MTKLIIKRNLLAFFVVIARYLCRYDVTMVAQPSILLSFRLCNRLLVNATKFQCARTFSIKCTTGFAVRRRITRFESNFNIGRRFYSSTMAPIVPPSGDPATIVASCIKDNKIMMFSKSYCPFCNKVSILYLFFNACQYS